MDSTPARAERPPNAQRRIRRAAHFCARLERIPVTKRLLGRAIIGSATFFDAYTVLVIAFAMPQLVNGA